MPKILDTSYYTSTTITSRFTISQIYERRRPYILTSLYLFVPNDL